jgi:hypothetical protein
MKTKFIGPIRDQLHSNKILLFGTHDRQGDGNSPAPQAGRDWSGIESLADGIDFVGNDFRLPLRTSRNQGIGSRAENATLPAPGNEGFMQIQDPLRYHYGLFNITGQLIKASESNEGAFKRALTVEMEGVTDALKRKMNIDAYGDATGNLTTVTGGVTSTTIPVASTVNFQVGEVVDFVDVTGVTYKGNARTVTAVNRAGLTITISGANITVVSTDRVVRASSDSTSGTPNNDLNQTINGLGNIVSSTGVLHTLNPATAGQQFWASTQIAAAGAVIGDTLLRQLIDSIGFESGSDDELVLITTRGIRTRYANTLTQFKRFNDAQSVKLRGGFDALMFDNHPFVIDDQCPVGNVFALNTKAMFWSEMSDWEWMDLDGETLKWEPRLDRYIGILYKYCNLGTWARNRHGKITGGADDVK